MEVNGKKFPNERELILAMVSALDSIQRSGGRMTTTVNPRLVAVFLDFGILIRQADGSLRLADDMRPFV